MDAIWVVGGVILALLGVAAVAYVGGRSRGREILEERALERALATRVGEVMSRPVVVARLDTTIARAAEMMLEGGFGSLPVVDDAGRMVGIVTESDLTGTARRRPRSALGPATDDVGKPDPDRHQPDTRPVTVAINKRVVSARVDEPVSEVAARMLDRNLRHVPVLDGDVPVGMVTRHDLLSQLVGRGKP